MANKKIILFGSVGVLILAIIPLESWSAALATAALIKSFTIVMSAIMIMMIELSFTHREFKFQVGKISAMTIDAELEGELLPAIATKPKITIPSVKRIRPHLNGVDNYAIQTSAFTSARKTPNYQKKLISR